jgi:hypothetical protein
MSEAGLSCAKTKTDLVVMPSGRKAIRRVAWEGQLGGDICNLVRGTLSPGAFFDYNRDAVVMSLTGSLPLLNNFLAGGEAAGGCLLSPATLVCCDAHSASATGQRRPIRDVDSMSA